MSRKLTKVDVARIWGEVSRLPEKDWRDLVGLRERLTQGKAEDAKTRKPRKLREKPDGGMS